MSTATKQGMPDTGEIPSDWAGSPLSTLHYQTPPTPNTAPKPTIVVGVSGSPASALALRWAAAEADRLDAQLKIVLIWNIEPRAYYAPAITSDDYDRRQERAVSGLAATVRVVLGAAPPDALTVVAQGIPERALVEHSTRRRSPRARRSGRSRERALDRPRRPGVPEPRALPGGRRRPGRRRRPRPDIGDASASGRSAASRRGTRGRPADLTGGHDDSRRDAPRCHAASPGRRLL